MKQASFTASSPFILRLNQGFTLVELMVVVMILSLFAGLMTLSVSTGEVRKNMAFYEHLQDNLGYIRLVSMEQMQPYGLAIKLAQGESGSQLVVVKLVNAYAHQQAQISDTGTLQSANSDPQKTAPTWQLDTQIEALPIPANVQIDIQPLNANTSVVAPLPWFDTSQAPPVIWFGTGEVTPVKITLQSIHPSTHARFQVGDTLVLNSAGMVERAP